MLNWLKSLFGNPKLLIKMAVDALDSFVDTLAGELDKVKTQGFLSWTSKVQAQWIIDWVQSTLYKLFKLDA